MKTTKWRWTNKRAIDFLLPMARDLVERFRQGEIALKPPTWRTGARGWWQDEATVQGPHGEMCTVVLIVADWGSDEDEHVTVDVTLPLERGKFDTMTLGWTRWRNGYGEVVEAWRFDKEYRGKGNGYYAEIDPQTGRIIRGEWD